MKRTIFNIKLLMSEFTHKQLNHIKEERGLKQEQVAALQRAASTYKGKVTKEELLDTFRRLGYIVGLFEDDLMTKFGKKQQKAVKITYDLLPSGKVQNFTVEEVD